MPYFLLHEKDKSYTEKLEDAKMTNTRKPLATVSADEGKYYGADLYSRYRWPKHVVNTISRHQGLDMLDPKLDAADGKILSYTTAFSDTAYCTGTDRKSWAH
jgi:hypothetical protein